LFFWFILVFKFKYTSKNTNVTNVKIVCITKTQSKYLV
jgi:hypothetical protein